MATVTWATTDPVKPILDTLLTCLTDALNGTPAKAPARMQVGHGTQVTFDSAPMGWVRPVTIYPSTQQVNSPDGQFVPRKQPFRWTVDVELGVIRCTATVQSVNNQPVLPTADAITAESATILDDARALRAAVQYLHPWRGDVAIKPWQPIGPSGGVAGGVIVVSVPITDDCKPTVV